MQVEAVRAAGVETVGLIGTKVAMSESFFVDRLEEQAIVRPNGRLTLGEDVAEPGQILLTEAASARARDNDSIPDVVDGELRNVMERLAILVPGETVEPDDVQLGTRNAPPPEIPSNLPLKDARDELMGYGPIQALVDDDTVNDIVVNGPSNVFIEREGRLYTASVRFFNDAHVVRVIQRILAPIGRRVDESTPMVDARLPDGSRVNAIIGPVAVDGPHLSIRKFKKVPDFHSDLLIMRFLTVKGMRAPVCGISD